MFKKPTKSLSLLVAARSKAWVCGRLPAGIEFGFAVCLEQRGGEAVQQADRAKQ